MHRLVLVASLMISQGAAGQDVEVRELENGQLELTLTASRILDTATAQRLILPRAMEACAEVSPVLGRYRFESREPTAIDPADVETTYRFTQEVSCGPVESSADDDTEIGIRRVDQVQLLDSFIKGISMRFLSDRSEGAFEDAYAALSMEMRSYSTFEAWKERSEDFNSASGPIVSADLWRVTVYDNPQGAPEPGVYIAVDYEIEYETIPFQCGYLMWFERPVGAYAITREESGSIPREVWTNTPESEMPALKAQLRCLR